MKREDEKFASSTLMEGFISVKAVIEGQETCNNDRKILSVYFDKGRKSSRYKELSYLNRKSKELGFQIVETDSAYLESKTLSTSHGGIIAECTDRNIPVLSEEDIRENGFYVYLEGIEDPYNFGFCIRSIYAAGADGIVLSPRNWMSASGVVCRSSAGASELANVYISEPEQAIRLFKSKNYKCFATDKTKEAVSAYDTDLKKPVFLAIGGERRGLSQNVLSNCDRTIMIDYGRNFRAALSAASAATILAFEIRRQNR